MTPKEETLSRCPRAYAKRYAWHWTVYERPGTGHVIGTGKTPAEAWRDAAKAARDNAT